MTDSSIPMLGELVREHARLLRRVGAGLRHDAGLTSWRSPAADRMRAEVEACARWLEWSAARYDGEADGLTRAVTPCS